MGSGAVWVLEEYGTDESWVVGVFTREVLARATMHHLGTSGREGREFSVTEHFIDRLPDWAGERTMR